MSYAMPLDQQKSYSNSHDGSIGLVIGVVIGVIIIGIISIVVGRLCSGRRVMGFEGEFDLERWAETKCSSCIDGRLNIVSNSQPKISSNVEAVPVQNHQETQH